MIKKNILYIFGIILFSLMFLSGIVYAWIVYQKEAPGIDASTSGVKFVYNIDSNDYLTDCTKEISNITFFDCDNPFELDYFLDMAYVMEIDVRNTGDLDINCQLTQKARTDNNTAYVKCLFAATPIVVSNEITSISDLFTVYGSSNAVINKFNNTASVQTFYVYIFGIQEDDDANNDFLSESYTFTIQIESSEYMDNGE